jgi:hypothetical protein
VSLLLLPKRKRRPTQVVVLEPKEAPPPQEVQPQVQVPREKPSFEKPMQLPVELRAAYEEHKKRLGDYKGPHVVRTTPEEDARIFARMGRLGKRARHDPDRNVDLLPEKEIVTDEIASGADDGDTFTFRGSADA